MLLSMIKQDPLVALVLVLCIILAISIHEFSHALSAYLQGDHTAEHEGRLTLNPFSHLDWMGSIMLLFVGFGWGKPVPVNPYNLKYGKWGNVMVSLAGPFSNLITFLLMALIYRILMAYTQLSSDNLLIIFLFYFGVINVGLMLFNLIPLPPLDGSKLMDALIPDRYYEFKDKLYMYGPYLLFGLLIMDIVLDVPVFQFLSNLMIRIVLAVF